MEIPELALFWPSTNLVKVSTRLATDFAIIDRLFSVATCDVVGAVVDVDTLVLVVRKDTEKLEVNTPSPSAVDTGLDADRKQQVSKPSVEDPMPIGCFFLFRAWFRKLKFSELE